MLGHNTQSRPMPCHAHTVPCLPIPCHPVVCHAPPRPALTRLATRYPCLALPRPALIYSAISYPTTCPALPLLCPSPSHAQVAFDADLSQTPHLTDTWSYFDTALDIFFLVEPIRIRNTNTTPTALTLRLPPVLMWYCHVALSCGTVMWYCHVVQ